MLCNKFYHDWKAQKESWKVFDHQIILDPNESTDVEVETKLKEMSGPIGRSRASTYKSVRGETDRLRANSRVEKNTIKDRDKNMEFRTTNMPHLTVQRPTEIDNKSLHSAQNHTLRGTKTEVILVGKNANTDTKKSITDFMSSNNVKYFNKVGIDGRRTKDKLDVDAIKQKIPKDPYCRIGLYRPNSRSEAKVVALERISCLTKYNRLRQVSIFLIFF